jgi:hypothetical protein
MQTFCSSTFSSVWSKFVDTLVDTLHADGPAAPRPPDASPHIPLTLPAVDRLVAIGDLHGDLGKARKALKLAGVMDDSGRWTGGTATVVQVLSAFCRRAPPPSWHDAPHAAQHPPSLLMGPPPTRWAISWTVEARRLRYSFSSSACNARQRPRGGHSTCSTATTKP